MDRSRTDYSTIRSGYGAEPGTYRIGVFGVESTDYSVTVIAADTDRTIFDTTLSGRVTAGAHHEYEWELPPVGDGTVTHKNIHSKRQAIAASAGVVSGLIVGAVGHRTVKRIRNTERPNQSPRDNTE